MLDSLAADLPAQLALASASDLAALPGSPAVYLLLDGERRPVQLATTQHLRRAVTARLTDHSPEEKTKRADLAEIVRAVAWRLVACPFDARWCYWRLARRMYPQDYRERIDFGPAWFLHVDWCLPVPELRVTERIWRLPGEFIGPWPTHKSAQQALEGLWDLFDLCRYPEQVRKTPHGTRCSYAEMGRCDAPCDGSVPLVAYVERSRAAWTFAGDGTAAWIAEAQQRMKDAAAALRFELAAQIKQQLVFARDWQTYAAPRVRRESALRCIIAHLVTRRRACRLFWYDRGLLVEGPAVQARGIQAQLAEWLPAIAALDPNGEPDIIRMEQTWLVARLVLAETRDDSAIVWLDADRSVLDTAAQVFAAVEQLLARIPTAQTGEGA
jgi:excinuclease UvrABC nuclease subunit